MPASPTITIRITRAELERLIKVAATRGVTRSDVVRHGLELALSITTADLCQTQNKHGAIASAPLSRTI